MAATTSFPYNTLDVFTTTRFTGNQLGLVHLPSHSALTQEQKQALAVEFNYSETVILYPKPTTTSSSITSALKDVDLNKDKGTETSLPIYSAQMFTPKSEIPFGGHPTIGTAVYIFENLERDADTIALDLKAGRVRMTYDRALKTARASIAHDVRIHEKRLTWSDLVTSQPGLDLGSDGSGASSAITNATFPLLSIVPGMTWVLVDFTDQPELLNHVGATLNDPFTPADLDDAHKKCQHVITGALYFKIYPGNGNVNADAEADEVIKVRQRMMGISLEDPATGSASCALGAYLAMTRGKNVKVEIEQGVEMGRASKIFVHVRLKGDKSGVETVDLSGQAIEVTSGTVWC